MADNPAFAAQRGPVCRGFQVSRPKNDTFLRALFGYNASPAGLQLLTWAAYLAIFVTLWHRSYQPRAQG